jgi:hypothetical protein
LAIEPTDPLRILAVAPAGEARCGLGCALCATRQFIAALGLTRELGSEQLDRGDECVERGGEIRPLQRFLLWPLAGRFPGRESDPA